MLKLKKYSFSGIGRFVEKQTIDLESKEHLIQIDGINSDTGGSSGSGKSTTAEALAYLLGINEIPATQLQARNSESIIWVEGEFEDGIKITRSKKDGLVIQTPEETISGNNKLAEEKLDQIIGVSRDLLKTMCYKRQKQGGFLLNLTPKQSYDFLMECLDLKDLQNKIYKLEDNIKNKYKPRRIELSSSLKVLEETVSQLGILIEQKNKPSPPDFVDEESLKKEITNAEIDLINIEKDYLHKIKEIGDCPDKPTHFVFKKEDEIINLRNSIEETKGIIQTNIINKNTEIEQASSAIFKINNKIKDLNQLKSQSIELYNEIKKMNSEKAHLESGNCPMCLREWQEEENKNKLSKICEEILKKEEILSSFLKEVEKIPHYKILEEKAREILENKKNIVINILEEKDLSEYQEKLRQLLNEKQNLESVIKQEYLQKLNEWNKVFKDISDKHNTNKSPIIKQINELNHKIDKAKIQQSNYENSIKAYENDCKNIQDKMSLNIYELNKQKKELEEIERNTLLSEESIRLIKNFTLQKFQDTLEYIGHRATQIINQIPNMANAVIYFENSKETKTGSIKNEINAIINLESDVAIPIKTLSGGERTSADFAIDLAVSEMIENTTQKGVNFLIIDEGFDGLDSISKIQCLEILKNINTEKKIIIIDHSSEVKEMLYDTILVKRAGEKSFIYE